MSKKLRWGTAAVILDFLAVALIVWGFVLAILDGLDYFCLPMVGAVVLGLVGNPCWIAHNETDGPLR